MCYNLPQVSSVQRRLNAGNTQEMLVEPVKDESPEHFSLFLKSGYIMGGTVHTPWNPSLSLLSADFQHMSRFAQSPLGLVLEHDRHPSQSPSAVSPHPTPAPGDHKSAFRFYELALPAQFEINRIVQYVSLESGCLTLGMMFLRFVRGVAHIRSFLIPLH